MSTARLVIMIFYDIVFSKMCCLGFDPSYLGGMNDLICFDRFDKIKKPPKIKIIIPGYFYPKEK